MGCLDENSFAAYFDLRLTPAENAALFAHVDGCARCARLLTEVAAVRATGLDRTAPDVGRASPAARPKMGRYQVERMLGMGGMGVVYAGHDPELDRKVAIKLLQPQSRISPATLRARLTREAQAMAKLSHPNVVNVYEIGSFGEQVFVVMEFVEGATLGGWLRQEERHWREILPMFLAAGAGLEAAHHAGIVHRDFKPDNVLVGGRGQIRVTDFGLSGRLEERETSSSQPSDSAHTWSGQVIGTPAYMAPEQMRGEATDARTDIFSFSVALYQALFGVRPFAGKDLDELRAAVEKGELQPPKKDVPRRLLRAVARGLRARPADRWASMYELLAALRADPTRRRRLWLGTTAATLLVVGAALLAQRWALTRARCDSGPQRLAGLWDAARKEALSRRFGAAQPLARFVGKELDRWSALWIDGYRDACEAARVRHEQSDELFDLRMQCLADRRIELAAVMDSLDQGDAASLRRADRVVGSLEPPTRCSDVAAMRRVERLPADPAARAKIDAARAKVAKVEPLIQAGRLKQALAAADEAVAAARAAGYRPLLAEALFLSGFARTQDNAGEAEAALKESARLALSTGRDDLVARSWIQLGSVEGYMRQHFDAALEMLAQAEAIEARLHDPARVEAQRLNVLTGIYLAKQDFPKVEESARRSLAAHERLFGADSPKALSQRETVAVALNAQGHTVEAIAEFERIRPALERSLGPDAVYVGVLWENLGHAYYDAHRYTDATVAAVKALAIFSAAYSHDDALTNELIDLGRALLRVGRFAEAEAPLMRALAGARTQAATGPDRATVLSLLAETAIHLHQPRQALEHLAEVEKHEPLGAPELAIRGAALAALGRPGAAALLRGALSGTFSHVEDRAAARLALAKLLEAHDPRQARAEAQRAAEELRAQGGDGWIGPAVDAWLAAHPS